MTRDFRGHRHDATRQLDIADIAKLIRADLTTAQHNGELPTEASFRVRIARFSGGQSLDVVIDSMPDAWTYNQPGRQPDYANNIACHGGHTPTAAAALRTVEAIVAAYNHDRSDTQTDYFNLRFYTNIHIDDQTSQRFRAQHAAATSRTRKAHQR